MFCCQVTEYHIEVDEGVAVLEFEFLPYIRLLCPGCHMSLQVEGQEGLTVSSYSLNFTDTSSQTLQLRVVRTPGSYSRIVRLILGLFVSQDGFSWTRYSIPNIRVTGQFLSACWFAYKMDRQ